MDEPVKRGRGRPRVKRVLAAPRRELERLGLHARAVDALRDMIIRGELPAGERIVEASICESLGLSRTPLREALKLLAAEGLIDLRPNQGATIAPLHPAQIEQLFEAVSGVERLAAELAAVRLTDAELDELEELQARMETHFAADERDDYFRLNQQIHRRIVDGAKNEVLAQTHAWLLARAERARYLALHTRQRWEESVQEHRDILAALKHRDSTRAGQLLGAHVAHTGDAVVLTLTRDQSVALAQP